jgi:predicted nucleic-acid-binding protein
VLDSFLEGHEIESYSSQNFLFLAIVNKLNIVVVVLVLVVRKILLFKHVRFVEFSGHNLKLSHHRRLCNLIYNKTFHTEFADILRSASKNDFTHLAPVFL